ncbi:MAG TPA: hypothetical protein DEA08_21190 [Planctomycetes bacterium]|nr:hypothetical protein [Planctomycetota bacterium]
MNDQDLPQEGYLDDDFARFRAQRLKKALPSEERPEPPPELFFGTTQRERSRIRAEEAWEREEPGELASLVEEEWEEPPQRAPAPPLPARPPARARLASPGLKRDTERRPRAG